MMKWAQCTVLFVARMFKMFIIMFVISTISKAMNWLNSSRKHILRELSSDELLLSPASALLSQTWPLVSFRLSNYTYNAFYYPAGATEESRLQQLVTSLRAVNAGDVARVSLIVRHFLFNMSTETADVNRLLDILMSLAKPEGVHNVGWSAAAALRHLAESAPITTALMTPGRVQELFRLFIAWTNPMDQPAKDIEACLVHVLREACRQQCEGCRARNTLHACLETIADYLSSSYDDVARLASSTVDRAQRIEYVRIAHAHNRATRVIGFILQPVVACNYGIWSLVTCSAPIVPLLKQYMLMHCVGSWITPTKVSCRVARTISRSIGSLTTEYTRVHAAMLETGVALAGHREAVHAQQLVMLAERRNGMNIGLLQLAELLSIESQIKFASKTC